MCLKFYFLWHVSVLKYGSMNLPYTPMYINWLHGCHTNAQTRKRLVRESDRNDVLNVALLVRTYGYIGTNHQLDLPYLCLPTLTFLSKWVYPLSRKPFVGFPVDPFPSLRVGFPTSSRGGGNAWSKGTGFKLDLWYIGSESKIVRFSERLIRLSPM